MKKMVATTQKNKNKIPTNDRFTGIFFGYGSPSIKTPSINVFSLRFAIFLKYFIWRVLKYNFYSSFYLAI